MTSFRTIGKKFIEWCGVDDDEDSLRHVRVATLIVEQLTQSSYWPEDDPRHPFNRYTNEHALDHLYKDLRQSMEQEDLKSLRPCFFKNNGIWAEEVEWLLLAYDDYADGDPNWDGPWHELEAHEVP